MSEEIPQELIDTGLDWAWHAPRYYRAVRGTHHATRLDGRWSIAIGAESERDPIRYAAFAEAVRPTAAEALAVARRMIEAAQ